MSPADVRSILTSWACWVESGRPIPFSAWPPQSILYRWQEQHAPTFRSRPLWHGRMKSFWLADVDRLLRGLPERRQIILLGMHLPRKRTDCDRAAELGITLAQVRYAREMAREALQAL